jgi:hypothetical protein
MAESDYDETRAVARLPNLNIEIHHRRPWQGEGEEMVITVRAVPSFEAFGRYLEAANPLLLWMQMMQAAWSPWLGALPGATAALRSPSERAR